MNRKERRFQNLRDACCHVYVIPSLFTSSAVCCLAFVSAPSRRIASSCFALGVPNSSECAPCLSPMALLLRKLSFLPLTREGLRCLALSARHASFTRAVQHDAVNNNVPETDDDEDEDLSDEEDLREGGDFANVSEDKGIQEVDCRVLSSVGRRPWVALQDETALKFRMDMPGITKDHVKVYLDNTKLIVKGKYPSLDVNVDEDDVLADNAGMYTAEITLPENAKKDKIKSEMKDGILLVTVPKKVTMIAVE